MTKKIVINDIKACHPNDKPSQTDMYYMRLANNIKEKLSALKYMTDEKKDEIIHR